MQKVKYIFQSLIFLVLALSFKPNAKSQQTPLFSHFETNNLVYNPASALPQNAEIAISGASRRQWNKINGAPITHLVNTRFMLKENGIGLGTTFLFDEVGPVNNIWAEVAFSYRLRTAGDLTIDLGLSAGLQTYKLRLSNLEANDVDALLANNDISNSIPNFGFGATARYKDLSFSIAAPRIGRSRIIDSEAISAGNAVEESHFYISASYQFLAGDNIVITPSVFMRMVKDAPLSTDLYLTAKFFDVLEISPIIRISESIGINVRYHIRDNIFVGYAYEGSSQKLRSVRTGGTHEFSAGFRQLLQRSSVSKPKTPKENRNNQRSRSGISDK